jgi:hypothetical protein
MHLVDVIFSLPTVIFSLLLALSVVYWLFVIVGAVDLDALGGHADGAMDGAIDGHIDGAIDGHVDGAIDGHVDGAIDGHADGAMDGGADGHADGATEGHDVEVEQGVFSTILSALKLRSAPVTVVLTVFALVGFLTSGLIFDSLQDPGWIAKGGLFLATSFGSLVATSVIIRPLGKIFDRKDAGMRDSDLLGKIAVVSTGSVTERFGQAIIEENGVSLTLQVRAEASSGLKKGSRCVIVDHDSAAGTFSIEKLPESDPRPRIAAPASQQRDSAEQDEPPAPSQGGAKGEASRGA